MHARLLAALPLLVFALAQPAPGPGPREIYDAALDSRALGPRALAPHAHAYANDRRSVLDGHRGMKKVRRKRSACGAATATSGAEDDAATATATSTSTISSVSPVSASASSSAELDLTAIAAAAKVSSTDSKTSSPTSTNSATEVDATSTKTSTKTTTATSDETTSTSAESTDALSSASTTASSSASASSAASTSSSSGLSGLLAYLFPTGYGSAHWTTSTSDSSALSFTSALKPLTAGSLPPTGSAPDGTTALVATYPAGTYGLSGSGYSFYTEGAHAGVNVTAATEVLFSYSAYFPDGFDFVKGGKMPGLYGGSSLAEAKSCSGGRQTDRDKCFSARMMWRTDGAGEFYNYFPTSATQPAGYCSTPPYSTCNPDYGDSIARGSFEWATGEWTTVAMRLKLNDAGSANGEQELFVNGQSVISLTGLEIRIEADTKIYGIMAQTFLGGSTDSYATPVDENAYFKDWSLAVLN
ncbi:hypothetical protein Q5752_006440 [Cryptotrichosporon argae]